MTGRIAGNKKVASKKIKGHVTSATGDKVVLKISEGLVPCYEGQRVIVSIPYERKTALGKAVEVSKVVAYGEIVNVSQGVVTIQSKRSNPIISKYALGESKGKERIMLVENID